MIISSYTASSYKTEKTRINFQKCITYEDGISQYKKIESTVVNLPATVALEAGRITTDCYLFLLLTKSKTLVSCQLYSRLLFLQPSIFLCSHLHLIMQTSSPTFLSIHPVIVAPTLVDIPWESTSQTCQGSKEASKNMWASFRS